mmetsp:Transcript_26154/g.72981  ORF Transcript_26154/g.72981 Transcript_26154/m.72981 type:complete len:462 (+) Transcript_26154:54-1439(+)
MADRKSNQSAATAAPSAQGPSDRTGNMPEDGLAKRFSALSRRMTIGNDHDGGPHKKKNHPPQDLVRPTIYRYTCRGKLALSNQREGLLRSAGACRGIASQLELVDIWRTVPREEAIQVFSQQMAAQTTEPSATAAAGSGAASPRGGTAASGGNASTTSQQALQTALESQVLVYPKPDSPPRKPNHDPEAQNANGAEHDDAATEADHTKRAASKTKPLSDAASSILFHPQDWNCYGTTEVDLLVLRDATSRDIDDFHHGEELDEYGYPTISRRDLNNEATIAAVAPYTSPGVNIRDVSHQDWTSTTLRDRTSTLRLGFLEVIYQQVEDIVDENEATIEDNNNKQGGKNGGHIGNNESTAQGRKANAPRKPTDTESFPTKFYEKASKIADHMKFNAKLLRDSVRDDFPGRTISAGQRIINHFDTTLDNMGKFASKIVSLTTGLWDDDGNNNDDQRRGGGRKGR